MLNKIIFITLFACFSFMNIKNFEKYSPDKNVVHWDFGSFVLQKNSSVSFGIEFYSPTAPGKYPVVVFLTGLDGIAPAMFYRDFLNQMSSDSESIIIAFNNVRYPSLPAKEELLFERTLNWTIENLDGLFNDKRTPDEIKGKVFPDLDTFGISLMAHSAAGHPVVSYLNKTCGLVRSLILLDPVDGYDPFGLIKIFITNPPQQLPFQIPTVFLSSGLSSSPKGKFTPCAPKNISNVRFYDSLSGPTWYLNFTSFGHADLFNDFSRAYLADLICATCHKDCDFSGYRRNIARAASYFLKAIQQKNQKYLEALEYPRGSDLFDANITIQSFYKLNGYDVMQSGPFCSHS